jgi:uncharacterized protein
MATTNFLHGAQVVDADDGAKVITTVASSVIGVIGTAPNADPTVFPLNTPVLIAGSQSLVASLSSINNGDDYGTLPGALQDIFDITGAAVVVVRVEEGETATATQAAIIGEVNANGTYTGAYALLTAMATVGVKPRILIAPGFTHQRTSDGVASLVCSNPGAGLTNGTYALVVGSDPTGTGAAGTATVSGGAVISCGITSNGNTYTNPPTFTLPAAAGTPTTAPVFTATIGTVGNAVVAELIPLAQRLRAVIIQDGPNTNNNDAIAMSGDFGSERVYLVDPWVTKLDTVQAEDITRPSSPSVAGLIAWVDNNLGFWWSPSNQELDPVIAMGRPIDFAMGDDECSANLLNASNVATIIRQNGFRLWGNRTLATDPNLVFLCVVRTRDIIDDSLLSSMLWAIDQGITKGFVDAVIESVNAYLRYLTALGAILGGTCWANADLNSPSVLQSGKIYFDFNFTPVYPAEEVTFTSHLTNQYLATIFSSSGSAS